jgi:hypothetical protein
MKFIDLAKETTITTGLQDFVLGGAVSADFQTFAGYAVGEEVPYKAARGAEWEIGVGTKTATGIARTTVSASSNGGALVNFTAGVKEVSCNVSGAFLSQLHKASDIPFSASIPLKNTAGAYMPNQQVGGAIIFSPAADPVRGAFTTVGLVADGIAGHVLSFPGFTKHSSSQDYDNRTGILNVAQFFSLAGVLFYSLSTAADAVPVDVIKPTASGAAVANATPAVVRVTMSENMDPAFPITAAQCTVSGHAVTAVAAVGNSAYDLTCSAAFVNGEVARVVGFTRPGANWPRDLAGNPLESFSNLAITNNVGVPITAPAQMAAPVATAGEGTVSFAVTAPTNGGSAILDYTLVTNTGHSKTQASGPFVFNETPGITVTGTVTARNSVGSSVASPASNSVVPTAPAADTSIRLNRAMAKVTESAQAPWTYVGTGTSGTDGTAGAVSILTMPANTDSSVTFKVIAAAADFMLQIGKNGVVETYTNNLCLWNKAGNWQPIQDGGTQPAPLVALAVAVGDLARVTRYNVAAAADYRVPTRIEISKDNGATWQTIYLDDGTTAGSRRLAYYVKVVPVVGCTLSVVASTGLA